MSGTGIAAQGLDEVIEQLQELERDGFDRGVRGAAAAVESTVRAQWAAGTGPDGEAWAPRKKDGVRALGELPARATFTVQAPELVITFEEDYAIYHQQGSPQTNLPQRRLVPWGESVAPPAWEEASDRGFKRGMGVED